MENKMTYFYTRSILQLAVTPAAPPAATSSQATGARAAASGSPSPAWGASGGRWGTVIVIVIVIVICIYCYQVSVPGRFKGLILNSGSQGVKYKDEEED